MSGVKILSYRQLKQKKYCFLPNIPAKILESFGKLTSNFIMIIWGASGNGKSNLIMQILLYLMQYGKVLYVSLEEGTEATMWNTVERALNDDCSGKIVWADESMTYEVLKERLSKRRSEQFVVIDSVQYFDINYEKYKELKSQFKNKTFIFISHAKGKIPDGKTADKIRYDAGIKVRVEGYLAFVISRYGGNKPYVIYEEGAKNYWGKKYNTFFKNKHKPKKTEVNEKADTNLSKV